VYPAGARAPDWSKAAFVGAGADTLRAALEETLGALAAFVTEGKIRHVGWSNVSIERLEAIRAVAQRNGFPQPVALQQQHSYLYRSVGPGFPSVDQAQLEYLRGRPDLTLVAYSPLLQGLYGEPG
jgi:aryl-alcohol dehydrogenase-like predicted oxidoreductase